MQRDECSQKIPNRLLLKIGLRRASVSNWLIPAQRHYTTDIESKERQDPALKLKDYTSYTTHYKHLSRIRRPVEWLSVVTLYCHYIPSGYLSLSTFNCTPKHGSARYTEFLFFWLRHVISFINGGDNQISDATREDFPTESYSTKTLPHNNADDQEIAAEPRLAQKE